MRIRTETSLQNHIHFRNSAIIFHFPFSGAQDVDRPFFFTLSLLLHRRCPYQSLRALHTQSAGDVCGGVRSFLWNFEWTTTEKLKHYAKTLWGISNAGNGLLRFSHRCHQLAPRLTAVSVWGVSISSAQRYQGSWYASNTGIRLRWNSAFFFWAWQYIDHVRGSKKILLFCDFVSRDCEWICTNDFKIVSITSIICLYRIYIRVHFMLPG